MHLNINTKVRKYRKQANFWWKYTPKIYKINKSCGRKPSINLGKSHSERQYFNLFKNDNRKPLCFSKSWSRNFRLYFRRGVLVNIQYKFKNQMGPSDLRPINNRKILRRSWCNIFLCRPRFRSFKERFLPNKSVEKKPSLTRPNHHCILQHWAPFLSGEKRLYQGTFVYCRICD